MIKKTLSVAALMAARSAVVAQEDAEVAAQTEEYNPGCFFQSKTVIIPHDDKKHRGGEDAAASNDTLLVVADGVGGWALRGINPGLYSERLTTSILEFHEADHEWTTKRLLFEGCKQAASEYEGTATVVTLKLLEGMEIQAANLGDSGYALFHVMEDDTLQMYHRSVSQQKTHNFPYQCGSAGDPPTDAQQFLHDDVREGDVVLVFSDGFHDNIYDSGMQQCIEEQLYGGYVTSMSKAADCLARKAYFLGKSTNFRSPWMVDFKYHTDHHIPLVNPAPEGFNFIGGKMDDITITVAQVFLDRGPEDPHRKLSENDTFFESKMTKYVGLVPYNTKEGYLRARLNDRDRAVARAKWEQETAEQE